MDFKGKVVLVSGAGRGAGRAIAQAFAKEGAIVAANDITPVNLDETLRNIEAAGGRAREYIFDVAKKMPVESMVRQVVDDLGRIDVLVNNAGVRLNTSLLDMRDWDWQRCLDVNLSGPFYCIQAAGKIMRAQGGGAIVNLAANIDRSIDRDLGAAFIASKAGLIGLTRTAARELAGANVRVNAICPEFIPPEAKQTDDARLRKARELAALVLFLCSPSPFLTGQVIDLDVDGSL